MNLYLKIIFFIGTVLFAFACGIIIGRNRQKQLIDDAIEDQLANYIIDTANKQVPLSIHSDREDKDIMVRVLYEEEYKKLLPEVYDKASIKNGLEGLENDVARGLVSAWESYIKLEETHPEDMQEFLNGIHICQKTLYMRILRRDYPQGYPSYQYNKEEQSWERKQM